MIADDWKHETLRILRHISDPCPLLLMAYTDRQADWDMTGIDKWYLAA